MITQDSFESCLKHYVIMGNDCKRGHPFLMSTRKSRFLDPSPVHIRLGECPHAINMKHTSLSWNIKYN